jgi:Uma2 family endonuclease
MATAPKRPDDELPRGMNVAAFLAWVQNRRGRYELHDGTVVAMAPERLGHIDVKSNAHIALRGAIKSAGVDCHAVADGIAIYVSESKWYQPDALVYCGCRADPGTTRIDNPVIVVEVISPSTADIDNQDKLVGYVSLTSVHHYLVVNPNGPPLVHHRRQSADTFLSRIVGGGILKLDPPGLEIDVASLFV